MKQFKRVTALAVGVAAFLVPATAMAGLAPGYGEFSACPDKAVSSHVAACVITQVNSGHLQLGTKDTPIEQPIKLVIGVNDDGQTTVPGSFDGGRQRIPGGLIGITGLDWLRFIYPFDSLQIYALPQLAGPVTDPLGTIGLPLKVRLDNVLLNNNCYIGSNSTPISLHLTTGTTAPPLPNHPISGQPGTLAADPVLPGVARSTGIRFVDNAFAAPAATNCDLLGLNLLVTALVNVQAGLPAAAGTNETIQNATVGITTVDVIYPPAGFK